MANTNPGVRQPTEFDFESYVERQFIAIHERLNQMTTLAEQLGIDEQELATAIPALANEISTLQTSLTTDEEALAAKSKELDEKLAALAADDAARGTLESELAVANAELAKVQEVTNKLTPVAEEANKLTPTSGAPPLSPPAGESGAGPAGVGPGGV